MKTTDRAVAHPNTANNKNGIARHTPSVASRSPFRRFLGVAMIPASGEFQSSAINDVGPGISVLPRTPWRGSRLYERARNGNNVRVLLEEARGLSRNLVYHLRARLEAAIGVALDDVERQVGEPRADRI
jgi:hypothetical protein